jgi:hypothetical protein
MEKYKTNPIEVCGVYTKIFFFNSEGYAIIDTEDYENVRNYCWGKKTYRGGLAYARAGIRGSSGETKIHQIILPCEEGFIVEHKDGNGLNNRKNNLRPATCSQNSMNTKLRSNNTSGCKGVTFDKKWDKWVAKITVDGKDHCLGGFSTKEEAVRVRKDAEGNYFKEFSYLKYRSKEGNVYGEVPEV